MCSVYKITIKRKYIFITGLLPSSVLDNMRGLFLLGLSLHLLRLVSVIVHIRSIPRGLWAWSHLWKSPHNSEFLYSQTRRPAPFGWFTSQLPHSVPQVPNISIFRNSYIGFWSVVFAQKKIFHTDIVCRVLTIFWDNPRLAPRSGGCMQPLYFHSTGKFLSIWRTYFIC